MKAIVWWVGKTSMRPYVRALRGSIGVFYLALAAIFAPLSAANADETHAREILRAMSDYLAAQEALEFDYDATYEVVTAEGQKLGLASSGTVTLDRPNRIRATRKNGFVDVETSFDGTTLTLLGKIANAYTQLKVPGTVDHLIDELRNTYGRPLPAADLLVSKPYEALMEEVVDVKDLGSGIIGGTECDWLAFRTDEVDWQIWIAQGERPYPCRYVITTKKVDESPQYTVDVRNWRTDDDVTGTLETAIPSGATKVPFEELREKVSNLPPHFTIGESQ